MNKKKIKRGIALIAVVLVTPSLIGLTLGTTVPLLITLFALGALVFAGLLALGIVMILEGLGEI